MKVGDLVRSVSRKNDLALVIGFKELYEGCGNKYPIIILEPPQGSLMLVHLGNL